jgi:hypothetical protein
LGAGVHDVGDDPSPPESRSNEPSALRRTMVALSVSVISTLAGVRGQHIAREEVERQDRLASP